MCQPMVMMLVLPRQAELTSTTGPGSRKRRISPTGKSCLERAMAASPVLQQQAWRRSTVPSGHRSVRHGLAIDLRLEADHELAAAQIEHRPLDHGGLRQ